MPQTDMFAGTPARPATTPGAQSRVPGRPTDTSATPSETPAGDAGPANPPAAATDVTALDFEAAFRALSEVVAALESGGQPLDEVVALYARGIALAERCNQVLSAAELQVRQIDAEGRDAGALEI